MKRRRFLGSAASSALTAPALLPAAAAAATGAHATGPTLL